MKIALQYINDEHGEAFAVQMTLAEWRKVVNKLHKYEQALKLRADLQEAFEDVSILKNEKGNKQALSDFLNEI